MAEKRPSMRSTGNPNSVSQHEAAMASCLLRCIQHRRWRDGGPSQPSACGWSEAGLDLSYVRSCWLGRLEEGLVWLGLAKSYTLQ